MIRPMNQSPVLRRLKLHAIQLRRFFMLKVLHADDSPHRLAMGVAIGLFIAFTPTFGIQLLLFFPLCWLLRGNSVVGFPALFATNMFTIIPVYMVQYWIGARMLGTDPWAADFRVLDQTYDSWWQSVQGYMTFTLKHVGPLGLGSGVTALLISLTGYVCMSAIVKQYRMRKFGSYCVPRRKPNLRLNKNAA